MKKETKLRKSIFGAYRLIIISCIFLMSLFTINYSIANSDIENQQKQVEFIDTTVLFTDSIKEKLIDEVDKVINKTTKGKHDENLAEALVNNALKYDIDICFMMSQAKIETCYGTTGIGRKTSKKSLFGVYKKKYKTYNEAVEDWCLLLKKRYLVNGKTEHDLMKKYVSKSGHRYASNPNYEKELRKTYSLLKRHNLDIVNLQLVYIEGLKKFIELDTLTV